MIEWKVFDKMIKHAIMIWSQRLLRKVLIMIKKTNGNETSVTGKDRIQKSLTFVSVVVTVVIVYTITPLLLRDYEAEIFL